jgi:chemotaxis response regulator CheB
VAAAIKLQAPLTVALLGRADDARAVLRRALEDLGAQVVFEGDPAGLPLEQVSRSGAQVMIVNLASGVEDDIDHLQPLFEDPSLNVVFNEAEVSGQLAGWDLARWARHLAAKVTGHDRTIPPPPAGSELLPMRHYMPTPGAPLTPAQQTPERAIEEFIIDAEDLVDAVPSDHLPFASLERTPFAEEPVREFTIDVGEVEGALAQIGSTPAVEERAVPEPEVPEILVREDEAAEFDAGLDLAALDAALEMDTAPPAPTSGKSDAELLQEALGGLSLDFIDDADGAGPDAVPDQASPPAPIPDLVSREAPSSGSTLGGYDLEFVDDADASLEIEEIAFESGDESSDLDAAGEVSIQAMSFSADGLDLDVADGGPLDDDVAALAAQLDAMGAEAPRNDVRDLEFIDFSDAPAPSTPTRAPGAAPSAAPTVELPVPELPAKKSSFGDLDLAPMDDAAFVPAPAPVAKPSHTIDFSKLSLSLEPTEEELRASQPEPERESTLLFDMSAVHAPLTPAPAPAPEAVAPDPTVATDPVDAPDFEFDALFAAMELAPVGKSESPAAAPGTIPRVIVLGASIGGPDALRTFLGGIPEGFPALFLLAQHLESGFFERLAQQLQKASKLPVRVPDAGQRAAAGEILVIPAKQRVTVERDGTIALVDHETQPKYTPSIDNVLRDAADRFGAQATAIIFSGMAGDAIEGSVYLTTQGGQVWAQDPASCVVSSMVDGARARGVVEFTGSPRELAERCVQAYGKG